MRSSRRLSGCCAQKQLRFRKLTAIGAERDGQLDPQSLAAQSVGLLIGRPSSFAGKLRLSFGDRMRHPKLTVEFSDLHEVAMGSPCRIATLRINGKWIPTLPETEWQDLHAQSDSGRFHALVRWDSSDELPAFRVVVLDVQKKIVVQSDPIEGCCTKLEWTGAGFSFQPF